MDIPLPRVIPDATPGGSVTAGLNAINSLADAMAMRKYNEIKSDWAPVTLPAEAASKLAYANLMGPQFLAKAMNNPAFMGNLTESQRQMVNALVRDAATAPTGINALNQLPQAPGVGQPSTNAFSRKMQEGLHKIMNIFGRGSSQQEMPLGSPSPNAMQLEMTGGQQSAPQNSPQNMPVPADGINHDIDARFLDYMNTPEGKKELAKQSAIEQTQGEPTYVEKAADYEGNLAQGKERGKIRATSEKELDQEYQQALQVKQPIDLVGKIISMPKFQNLRNIPGFQKLQMNGKATFGTPEEKKLIGEFQAAARQVVAATVKGFGGRILASEIPLSESMKLSDNDSIESMLGKYPVIKAFNEMTLQRSRIASDLMKKQHLDKGEALEQADKMVDGEAIRRKAENALEPPITEEDITTTMRETGMSRPQILLRLKNEGRYNG